MDKEKFLLYVCFLGVVAMVGGVILSGRNPLGGVNSDSPDYYAATAPATITCTPTTTPIVSTQLERVFFNVTASTSVTLCKASTCNATSGMILAAGGTFNQDDGYKGPYSCTGRNALNASIHAVYK